MDDWASFVSGLLIGLMAAWVAYWIEVNRSLDRTREHLTNMRREDEWLDPAADHEHVYRCQDCGEIGRGPERDEPLRPGVNPLADQLIEENSRLRRERNEWMREAERLKRLVADELTHEAEDLHLYDGSTARRHPMLDDEVAHWKKQALRHCNRADRAEALLAAKEIHFTDGTPCWCDPIIEDYSVSDGVDSDG